MKINEGTAVDRELVDHLLRQIGYHVGARMIAGDQRTLPEIVEEAEKATAQKVAP